MVQHVRYSIHIKGGLLDYAISKEASSLRISNVDVSVLRSDHHVISCHISIRLLKQHMRTVSFMKISDINVDDFKMDIKRTNIYRNHLTIELNDLVNGYDHELKQLLDLHTPFVTRQPTTRRLEPWFNSDVQIALRIARSHERKWRKDRTNINIKQQFTSALNTYSHMLIDSKQKHFLDIMKNNAGNQQKLFKSMDEAIIVSHSKRLPSIRAPKC